MATFTINANRLDPYKNFKFRLYVQGSTTPVAGISRVSALTRTTNVISHREGGDPSSPHKMPGQTEYGPITLERGVTHDVTFDQWANKVWYLSNSKQFGQEVSLKDFRMNLTIALYNEAGQKVMAYNIFRAWVSEYNALPELDGNGDAVAIQSLTLQNEGWERDSSIKEPTEPSFLEPPSS
jgi:phage tail-like protein